MSGEAKVENIGELTKTLNELASKVDGETLATAAHSGLLIFEGQAKIFSPYDEGVLRQSIHTEAQSTGAHSAEARSGTNVEYGPYQEFGTYKMAAQPFIRPAWDQTQGQVLQEVIATIKEMIGA